MKRLPFKKATSSCEHTNELRVRIRRRASYGWTTHRNTVTLDFVSVMQLEVGNLYFRLRAISSLCGGSIHNQTERAQALPVQ